MKNFKDVATNLIINHVVKNDGRCTLTLCSFCPKEIKDKCLKIPSSLDEVKSRATFHETRLSDALNIAADRILED